MFLPAVWVWGVDIGAVFHEEINHFVMTCTDGVMKSCDTISVGSTRIVHLGGKGQEKKSSFVSSFELQKKEKQSHYES